MDSRNSAFLILLFQSDYEIAYILLNINIMLCLAIRFLHIWSISDFSAWGNIFEQTKTQPVEGRLIILMFSQKANKNNFFFELQPLFLVSHNKCVFFIL